MRVTTSLLAVASILSARSSDAASAAWPGTATNFDLTMKTLILSSEYDGVLPQMVLDGYSTPYERTEKLPNLANPDYQSIVVSRSVDNSELELMRTYCSKYGTRIVYLNSDVSERWCSLKLKCLQDVRCEGNTFLWGGEVCVCAR